MSGYPQAYAPQQPPQQQFGGPAAGPAPGYQLQQPGPQASGQPGYGAQAPPPPPFGGVQQHQQQPRPQQQPRLGGPPPSFQQQPQQPQPLGQPPAGVRPPMMMGGAPPPGAMGMRPQAPPPAPPGGVGGPMQQQQQPRPPQPAMPRPGFSPVGGPPGPPPAAAAAAPPPGAPPPPPFAGGPRGGGGFPRPPPGMGMAPPPGGAVAARPPGPPGGVMAPPGPPAGAMRPPAPMQQPLHQQGPPAHFAQQQQQQQQPAPGAYAQGPPSGGPHPQYAPPGGAQPMTGGQMRPPHGPPGMMGAAPPQMMGGGMALPPQQQHHLQQQQQQPGMMPPGRHGVAPPGAPAYGGAPPGGGFDAYAGQRLVEQFEALALAAGPGAPEPDPRSFPRPCGEERAAAYAPQPPFDAANCSADNMRPTVMGVPGSTALRMRWQLPLGIVVRPMADEACGHPVPVIPLGSQGIVRCRRCRTYVNPFCQWVDGGRRFKCNVCAMLNEAPVEYFSTLDANGVRRDIDERPELRCGTVEWVAPAEYMVRPPMPPVYFFAIDVSAAAYASGMVGVVAEAIRASLDDLPGDERTMVGFLTYDSSLHYYNLKSSLNTPQMLVIAEVDEPFLPLPDDLLVNLRESRAVIEALLDALPGGYSNATPADSAMGPALQAAFLVMGHVGGKLLLFQSALPSVGIGRTKPSRENLNLYNTEREPSLRNPDDGFFKRYAGEASARQITLDVFLGSNGYADLPSIAAIPRYTCGQVYHYPGFHAPRDGPRLAAELRRNLTRPTAWEAVMRIRCSRGLKISSFHGHFFNRSTDLLALPTCDPDKAFAVQISHEETMVGGPVAFVQCALLHTSSNGERRIRVHTMMLPVLTELSEMYRAADAGATAALLAKLGVEKALTARLEDTRQALVAKLSAALREYRLLHGAHVRNHGALIYPTSLRYLPAFVLGLLKTTALRGTGRDVMADDRAAAMHALMAAPVDDALRCAYPDVYALTDDGAQQQQQQQGSAPWGAEDKGQVILPPTVPPSLLAINPAGAYLVDNGAMLVLWVGRDAPAAWLAQVLGPDAANPGVDPSTLPLEPPRDTPLSQRVARVVRALRGRHAGGFAPAFAVRQGTPLEAVVGPLFVEDRAQGQFGYGDFLQQLQRGVASK